MTQTNIKTSTAHNLTKTKTKASAAVWLRLMSSVVRTTAAIADMWCRKQRLVPACGGVDQDHDHDHHILALQIFQRLSSLTPAAWTLTSQKPKVLWLGWIVVRRHHSLSAGGIVASATTASLQQNCPVKEFLSIRLVLHVCCKVSGFCGGRTVCQHCKLLLGMPAIVSHNSKSNNPLLCSTSCIEQCAECQPM